MAADEGFKCFQTTCKRRRKAGTKASLSGTGRLQKHRLDECQRTLSGQAFQRVSRDDLQKERAHSPALLFTTTAESLRKHHEQMQLGFKRYWNHLCQLLFGKEQDY